MKCETCKHREWCPDKTLILCPSYAKDQDKVERLKAAKASDRRDTITAIKVATVFVTIATVWLYLPAWFPWMY